MARDIFGLVDRQIRRSQALRRAAMGAAGITEPSMAPGPVITISRQRGSCGRQVAERLAQRLGWSLWDRDLVDAIAKDAEVNRRAVELFDEKTISEIEVLARTLTGQLGPGGFFYEQHLIRVLLSIGRHGYAVILGRGANLVLKEALNIRLVASEELRVSNVMAELQLSREEAIDRIHQSDQERAEFVRRIYRRDIGDPLAYDLVITMDSFEVEGAAEVILAALNVKARSK